MAKFIEVTDNSGIKRFVNTAWVEEIWDGEGGATIYFAFSTPDATEQDYLRTKESYEEIKMKVWGC
jgi:hypothetical protein